MATTTVDRISTMSMFATRMPTSPVLLEASHDSKTPAAVCDSVHRGLAKLKEKYGLVSVIAPNDLWEDQTATRTKPAPLEAKLKKQPYDGMLMRQKHGRSDFGHRVRYIKSEVHILMPLKYLRKWRDMPVFESDGEDGDRESLEV